MRTRPALPAFQKQLSSKMPSVFEQSAESNLMSMKSKQILSSKQREMNQKEAFVIQKYFRKDEEAMSTSYIDFYLQRNKQKSYVTEGLDHFEAELATHVKGIRDGSALIKSSTMNSNSSHRKVEDIFNEKIKRSFKFEPRTEQEAKRLFEMVVQSTGSGACGSEPRIGKVHLKAFVSHLDQISDSKLKANRVCQMIHRLEKAMPSYQQMAFTDFLKFVCQPTRSTYDAIVKSQTAFQPKLSESQLENLWTSSDHTKAAAQEGNHQELVARLKGLKAEFERVNANFGRKTAELVYRMKENQNHENQIALARYQDAV